MNTKLRLKILERYGSQANFSMEVLDDESVISRVIRGRKMLNAEKQAKWAKALGCKPKGLFSQSMKKKFS